jgi:hypothetical protein
MDTVDVVTALVAAGKGHLRRASRPARHDRADSSDRDSL